MSTHLYCVLPDAATGEIPPGLSGVEGARVRAIPLDHLVAWVSDVPRDVPVSVDGVRAHDAVVEAALETGSTPVPARFGQRFDDDLACQLALTSRAASVESLVTGVQGLVEMTILIAPSTKRMLRDLEPVLPEMVDTGAPGSGRKYLETLRAREAATGTIGLATEELADRIAGATSEFVRRTTVHKTGTPLPLRTISHLVAREDLEDYREAIGAVDGGSEFRFLVIGPRAPYSFCALKSDGGKHGMNLAD
ncbi:MAG: GvpL/GvpF family gas vesicle protein [Gemmatimonadaceae bacterium]